MGAVEHLTVVEVTVADGPLDERRLGWVADLYGPVDPKYRSMSFLDHLLLRGPGGPALHAFALAGERPVGHAAIVPTPARRGDLPLSAGKLEALIVDEEFRGRRQGEEPVARTLLSRLYERADTRGIELIHALVSPRVGRVIGFTRLDGVGSPSLVALLRPRARTGRGRFAEVALGHVQGAARRVAGAVGGGGAEARVRRAEASDADLLRTPPVPPHGWAVVADDTFEWYADSSSIRILELSGAHASRALVQLPESPGEPLRVAGWRADNPAPRSAFRFLIAAAGLAESAGAATLRLQVPRPETSLTRAARALGFVRREDLTTLWVRARDPTLARADAVVPTAMLYLGF